MHPEPHVCLGFESSLVSGTQKVCCQVQLENTNIPHLYGEKVSRALNKAQCDISNSMTMCHFAGVLMYM